MKRGLPHFIENYSASTDIWTRTRPALLPVYFSVGMANAVNHRWSFGENLLAAAAAFLLLGALWAAVNLARRRPLFRRPDRVGLLELVVMLAAPASLALLFGWQWRSALVTVAALIVALAVSYLVTSYGLVPMTRWAIGRMLASVQSLGALFVRALPLLLLFVTFLFINAEVWQVAGGLVGLPYVVVVLLFFALGTMFVVGRLPTDVSEIGHFDSWAQARACVSDSDVGELFDDLDGSRDGALDPNMSRRQWLNVGLVLLFSQGVVITLVALGVGTFFVVFGTLAIGESEIVTWTQSEDVNVFARFHLGGQELIITEELLRVSGFLAAFTALYFTVVLVNDENYRAQFRSAIVAEVREAFAVKLLYERSGSVDGTQR